MFLSWKHKYLHLRRHGHADKFPSEVKGQFSPVTSNFGICDASPCRVVASCFFKLRELLELSKRFSLCKNTSCNSYLILKLNHKFYLFYGQFGLCKVVSAFRQVNTEVKVGWQEQQILTLRCQFSSL